MSIFPGFGQLPTASNPDLAANTAALNKRNEQFDLRQVQRAERIDVRDKRRAEDVAFREAQELTRLQERANQAQNENRGFETFNRPVATSPDAPSDSKHGTLRNSTSGVKQSTSNRRSRRGSRRVRRGR